MQHFQIKGKQELSKGSSFFYVPNVTANPPSLFIRSIRLTRAKELLREAKLTVTEIAYETGFSSPQYFPDAFFEEFGQRSSALRSYLCINLRIMEHYLTKTFDWKTDEIARQYDELPLWSAPFGLLMLEHFPIGDFEHYLDIGCGTGFPLIEIAQRLGPGCQAFGIDPWAAALRHAGLKIKTLGLSNIRLLEADAASTPFPDHHFDLITSNLGVNNFDNPALVLSECYRVLKPGSSLCLTTNLTGTFREFYEIFGQTLTALGLTAYAEKLQAHIDHRGTLASTRNLLEKAGFRVEKQVESTYQMRFYNGSAFLNHAFIILGFMDSWRNLFSDQDRELFFERFEQNLNAYAKQKGGLLLSVPMAYVEAKK